MHTPDPCNAPAALTALLRHEADRASSVLVTAGVLRTPRGYDGSGSEVPQCKHVVPFLTHGTQQKTQGSSLPVSGARTTSMAIAVKPPARLPLGLPFGRIF